MIPKLNGDAISRDVTVALSIWIILVVAGVLVFAAIACVIGIGALCCGQPGGLIALVPGLGISMAVIYAWQTYFVHQPAPAVRP